MSDGDEAGEPRCAAPDGSPREIIKSADLPGPAVEAGRPPREQRVPRWLWGWWLSPRDQPRHARPLLLLITALATTAYAWGMAHDSIELFYGAAARSMSESWHAFVFGAFDPAATVTVDKLPGALWLQALSLRVFGFHVWAIVLPQVVEGALTILALYRAVRQLVGPNAALAAAAVVATSPVTVLLNRGNISDTLLILLLVLAADATSRAVRTGRLRSLLLAGVWVGLAFQAKMTQAWLVLPALAVTYLLAAPAARARTRAAHVALAGMVTGAVSVSWIVAVSLVPANSRPFVDGSRTDSLFAQVFYYNGIARFGHQPNGVGPLAPFLAELSRQGLTLNAGTDHVTASWSRLLTGPFGRDDAWLLPAALVATAIIFVLRRGADRRDPVRACGVLWGGWLVVTFAVFSTGRYLNSYYVAALIPAVAAIIGVGASMLGPPPWGRRIAAIVAVTLACCVGYGGWLVRGGVLVPAWLVPVSFGLAVVSAVALGLSARQRAPSGWTAGIAVVTAVTILVQPAATAATVVVRRLGPFDTPYEPLKISSLTQRLSSDLRAVEARDRRIYAAFPKDKFLYATVGDNEAAFDIFVTGREVLPIGGYRGSLPAPTLAQIRNYVTTGQLSRAVIPTAPASDDPRLTWFADNCDAVTSFPQVGTTWTGYVCGQTEASVDAG